MCVSGVVVGGGREPPRGGGPRDTDMGANHRSPTGVVQPEENTFPLPLAFLLNGELPSQSRGWVCILSDSLRNGGNIWGGRMGKKMYGVIHSRQTGGLRDGSEDGWRTTGRQAGH